jgi:hypothetical protein
VTHIRPVAIFGIALGFLACSHPTGPSLSAVILNQTLVSTAKGALAQSICCCHVEGQVQNTSTIPVDIILDWAAKDASGNPIGLATDFEKNLAPAGVASFNGAGIFAACSQVSSLVPTISVIGVYAAPNP